jgi:CMP-N,N'-diacetyllegionaminic acid synthase
LRGIRYLGLVPARGGSRGIPRKNLADLGGKPLVQYSIEAGLASARLDALLLSSDDAEILALGARLGCAVVGRPAELAADDASMLGTALHALDHTERELGLRAEALVLLQPTSPFRTAADLDGALAAFERSGADTLASVVPVDQHPCDCVRAVDGRLERAVPLPRADAQRQDFPEFHYLDGAIFVARVRALRDRGLFVDEGTAVYPLERSHGVDINDAFGLAVARGLVAARGVAT